eukprot:3721575-Amphidinium_carterae.2
MHCFMYSEGQPTRIHGDSTHPLIRSACLSKYLHAFGSSVGTALPHLWISSHFVHTVWCGSQLTLTFLVAFALLLNVSSEKQSAAFAHNLRQIEKISA